MWHPESGENISCSCCAVGMVIVYLGGGHQGRLVALQAIKAASPAKRKRTNFEEWSLAPVAAHSLASDPSCMEMHRLWEGKLMCP